MQTNLNRRAVLLSSSACLLSACVTCGEALPPLPTDRSKLYSDAHVHFFNASDLPVANFLRFVALNEFLPDAPQVVLAIVDIAAKVVKGIAVTIKQERRVNLNRLNFQNPNFHEGVAKPDFSNKVAIQINDVVKDAQINFDQKGLLSTNFNPLNNMTDSYVALAAAINLFGNSNLLSDLSSVTTKENFLKKIYVNEDKIKFILDTEITTNQSPKSSLNITKQILNLQINTTAGDIDIWQTLKWIFLMTRSRCFHVNQYVSKLSPEGQRPSTVLNLLVDYDKWLDDKPVQDSSHILQVNFWNEYSKEVKEKIDIHTFAGYDPLKHAIQKVEKSPILFDELKRSFLAGKIAGFKVYPPMGFYPIGNTNKSFIGTDRLGNNINGIGNLVEENWSITENAEGLDLGTQLDEALIEFYSFCTAKGNGIRSIPILTHASPTLLTAENFYNRPHPMWWRELIEKPGFSDLRVCLGHFAGAKQFIAGMAGYNPRDTNTNSSTLWALDDTANLLNMSRTDNGRIATADVYVDIGYMEELLSEESLATNLPQRFFEALFKYCEFHDPECKRIMFGSDWIMLGREKNHENYAAIIRGAMLNSSWANKPAMMRNFFTNNLRRFLYLDPI